METVETVEALQGATGTPLCVLTESSADPLARQAEARIGMRVGRPRRAARRPRALVDGEEVEMVLFVLGEDRAQHRLDVLAGPGGLVVAGDAAARDLARDALAGAEDVPTALIALVQATARASEDVMDDLEDECQQLAERSAGFSSSPHRRTLARLRALLFQVQEFEAATETMLDPDEELAQVLGAAQERRRKRAAAVLAANSALAGRLRALLGDVLAEQGTVVSERLTLVATIFLPLSLATGFFGMNFTWLDVRLGTFESFLGLGVALPAVLTVLTLAVIHRLTRTS